MDEFAKAIQKKYIEDITNKYPLNFFICLFMLIISSYIYSSLPHTRLLDGLSSVKVSFIFDFKKGISAEISVWQLSVCIFFAILLRNFYTSIIKSCFQLLSKSDDFSVYEKQIRTSVEVAKSDDQMVNYFLSKDISSQLEKSRSKIRSMHNLAEVVFTLSISMLWGVKAFKWIDWFLFIASILYIIYTQWKVFHYYIREFIPYYITEKTLLGTAGKFGDEAA